MTVLVCGSYAYDHIMVFRDKFKNHILPDKVHMLNVSFLVSTMRREFGGCGGNIVYNLNLLGESVIPMATVGQDFAPYFEWLEFCKINHQSIKIIPNAFTGQAFITTDEDDNQITAFHPGAMDESHNNHINTSQDIQLGIISPDGKEGMIQHAREFYDADIPFVFDPGQGIPMFSSDELNTFIQQADFIACNDYEAALICDKTKLSLEEISTKVKALIVTKGSDGSTIYADEIFKIKPVRTKKTLDPTGCGDAYRAGLLYGLTNQLDWQTTGQIASLMGTIKIEHTGTQNHRFTNNEFRNRYKKEFGEVLF